MKKQNNNTLIVFGILVLILVVFLEFESTQEEKYNSTMDKYADLWCKGQSYENLECLSYEYNYSNRIFLVCQSNDIRNGGIFGITPNSSLSPEENCLNVNGHLQPDNFITGEFIEPEKFCKTIETKPFETGRYLPQENKIECFGEKTDNISYCPKDCIERYECNFERDCIRYNITKKFEVE